MTSDFNDYYEISVGDGVHGPGGWTATVDVIRRDTHATVWSSGCPGSTLIEAREGAMDVGTAWCRRNGDQAPEGWSPTSPEGRPT